MPKNNNFIKYFNHLIDYQNQSLPDNKLYRDYIIIYDYLMDLLQKDDVIGKFLVRRKQQASNINADILLDLTKLFNARSYVHEPFLCLTLEGCDNKQFINILHPFCNRNLSIVSRNITKNIWLALQRGLSRMGTFVRGFQGDIYELSISSKNYNDNYIIINAYNEDISLNINLRILIKFTNHLNNERKSQPYPKHELNKEWFALVPRRESFTYEVCFPQLELELKHKCSKLVLILRLLRFLFEKHKQLSRLDVGFVEAIIYSEYLENVRGLKNFKQDYMFYFKGALTRIFNAFETKKSPYFWNERFNLVKYFDNICLVSTLLRHLNIMFTNFNSIKKNESLTYEEFFEFFDFKMDPFSYEVDQFGIFKSY
ncbi:hypothetical protein FF38_02644 [Lucilia cuprina]|uniref:Mab-21-like HhH/H2TH-like domain-containing protein n=1 Tax=Lucilia cuprina TaxID=7375 RepID=A0A0L0C4L7_LUCCU|nr:hypothetical protein CVS40_10176 [Lucilia cuprina]KNC27186.1 hypothetical protein FF38_02644 [Lucilia cuprina]